MDDIDFIIPWVDGGDPVWLASKRMYDNKDSETSAVDANSNCRFRENGLLRYWFRSIEEFAPWVRQIHFVTCGHYPDWLNTQHPKLHLVKHSDYIPEEYLPTFNSNTIELNYHRINDLSEKFVLFNDDIFILRPASPDFFFSGSNPVLESSLRYPRGVGYNNWSRIVFNNYCIVNRSFNIGDSIWNNRRKWFSIKELGYKQARKNFLCFLANRTLPVESYGHIALPHLKSTLQELWNCHPDVMDNSCRHKFRSDEQVNHWLLCAWDQAAGHFSPARTLSRGRIINLSRNNVDWVCSLIRNQAYPQICVNENEKTTDPDFLFNLVADAFNSILPEKSSFELF